MSQLCLHAHQGPVAFGKIYSLLKRSGEFGLSPGAIEFDWLRVMARKEQIVLRTDEAGTKRRYRHEGIALFKGTAVFEDEHHIRVDEQVLSGDKIMIATGSKPARPAIAGINPRFKTGFFLENQTSSTPVWRLSCQPG